MFTWGIGLREWPEEEDEKIVQIFFRFLNLCFNLFVHSFNIKEFLQGFIISFLDDNSVAPEPAEACPLPYVIFFALLSGWAETSRGATPDYALGQFDHPS